MPLEIIAVASDIGAHGAKGEIVAVGRNAKTVDVGDLHQVSNRQRRPGGSVRRNHQQHCCQEPRRGCAPALPLWNGDPHCAYHRLRS